MDSLEKKKGSMHSSSLLNPGAYTTHNAAGLYHSVLFYYLVANVAWRKSDNSPPPLSDFHLQIFSLQPQLILTQVTQFVAIYQISHTLSHTHAHLPLEPQKALFF